MKLHINGKLDEIDKESITIAELLELKKVNMPDMVTIELNGDILDRSEFSSKTLADGDAIELLYFMGGGA